MEFIPDDSGNRNPGAVMLLLKNPPMLNALYRLLTGGILCKNEDGLLKKLFKVVKLLVNMLSLLKFCNPVGKLLNIKLAGVDKKLFNVDKLLKNTISLFNVIRLLGKLLSMKVLGPLRKEFSVFKLLVSVLSLPKFCNPVGKLLNMKLPGLDKKLFNVLRLLISVLSFPKVFNCDETPVILTKFVTKVVKFVPLELSLFSALIRSLNALLTPVGLLDNTLILLSTINVDDKFVRLVPFVANVLDALYKSTVKLPTLLKLVKLLATDIRIFCC